MTSPGRHLDDGVLAVDAGVGDLGAAGSDQQEGHREFALLHQHLTGDGRQRSELRSQRDEGLDGGSCEDIQVGEVVGSDSDQAGHVTRLRRLVEVGKESVGGCRTMQ